MTYILFKYNCYSGEGKNGYQILCEDINNLPHAFIEVGDYALFLNNKEMYGRFTDEKKDKEVYALNILFIEKITISLIGQPFFKLFHTKFDYENKVLKFYSDQPGSKNFTWVKPIDDKAKNYEPVGSSWMNDETIKIINIKNEKSVCLKISILIFSFLLSYLHYYLNYC